MAGDVQYLLPLLGGLAGSLHCVGMCGPFAIAMGQGDRPRRRSLLYNAGRLGTLLGMGAVSGAFGAVLVATGPAALASRLLAVAAGLLMLVIALEGFGVASLLGPRAAGLAHETVGRALASVMHARHAAAPLAFGVFNALLPCHLIYAFAAQAAAKASAVEGILVMGAFGLGTLPVMLGLGLAADKVPPRLRAGASRLAAALVLAFALLTMARGLGLLPGHAEHAEEHGGHHQLDHREHDRGAE